MGCFNSKAADAAPASAGSSAGVSGGSAGLQQHLKLSGQTPSAFLTATYPFVVCLNGIQKTVPVLKSHDGLVSFQECVGTLRAAFEGEVADLRPADEYKCVVCGPVTQKSPTLYYYVMPDNVCHRWVQPVNMTDDSLAFVVARCTTQPCITLHMVPCLKDEDIRKKYQEVNFDKGT